MKFFNFFIAFYQHEIQVNSYNLKLPLQLIFRVKAIRMKPVTSFDAYVKKALVLFV